MGSPGQRRPQHEGRALTRSQVVVLDYGSGNLRSAQRALERVGVRPSTVTAGSAIAAIGADGLVIPGVGAFAACMSGLLGRSAAPHIVAERLRTQRRPLLAICVGMQVVFADRCGTR